MIMFFLNVNDKGRFLDYINTYGLPLPKAIGKQQMVLKENTWPFNAQHYQQYRFNGTISDLTAMKLMFDIRHSLF